MMMYRSPNLLTEKLRRVITRDTIIIVHIAFAIAAILDAVYLPYGGANDKYFIWAAIAVFILIGFWRLRRSSILARRPLVSIIAYVVLGLQAQIFLVEVKSYWPFFWLVPIFLASFYYGKKLAFGIYLLLGVAILLMLFVAQESYVTHFDDYLFNASIYVIVGAFALLFSDTMYVSEEDRKTLVDSLEKTALERQRLNSLMSNMTDAILVVDPEGKITMHNPAALGLLNTHNEIRGQSIDAVATIEIEQLRTSFKDLILSSKHPHSVEAVLRYGEDDIADIQVAIVPIVAKNNSQSSTLLVMRDITAEKTAQNERNSFISILSHELRTPLATAEGLLSNVDFQFESGSDPSKMRQAISQVRDEVIHITRITNDLELMVDSSPEAEQSKMTEVSVKDILNEIQAQFAPKAAAKKLQFSVIFDPSLPEKLRTHVPHLKTILAILTSNAIKFTEEGMVRVTAKASQYNLLIEINDTGEGIATADQKRIFRPFTQAENFESRRRGGTGTGLFIAKRLASLLGGSINLASELHKGSTFTVILPLNFKQSIQPAKETPEKVTPETKSTLN